MTWEQVAELWFLGFGIVVIGGLWSARYRHGPRDNNDSQGQKTK